jgi:group II intron reverse transcriptase/maturase
MGKNVSEFSSMLYEMAKTDSIRRFHSLYDKVQRMDFLEEAWKQVSENGGSAGTDGMTIRSFSEQGAQQLLEQIQQELRERTYRPSPLRRVWIPKPNGKKRGLGIPTVKDRIVQTAVKMVIEPLFECDFEPFSYGFRPNKSAHDAVEEIVKYLNFGCEHVVDADITACFDNIPRHNLMMQIAKRISDGALLHLIRQCLDAGIMENNEIHAQERGTPQGSPLSPLLANIFLDQLDKQWKHSLLWLESSANAHLVRYADDLVILSEGDAETVKRKLDDIMQSIGLQLNAEKTRVVEAGEGFDFLGFSFERHYSKRKRKRVTNWYPSARSKQRIRERILEMTHRSKLASTTPEETREQLVPVLNGWANYFIYSSATAAFTAVWEYAKYRLMIMYCGQHNVPKWKKSAGPIMDIGPPPMLRRKYNAIR